MNMKLTQIVLLASALYTSGCGVNATTQDEKDSKYIQGIVKEEKYIPASVTSRDTAAFGNSTMQVGESKYSFSIQTPKGMYYVSVTDAEEYRKEATDLAVNVGSKVMLKGSAHGRATYYKTQEPGSLLSLWPYEIIVMPK